MSTLLPTSVPLWMSTGSIIPADWWPVLYPVAGIVVGFLVGLHLAGIVRTD